MWKPYSEDDLHLLAISASSFSLVLRWSGRQRHMRPASSHAGAGPPAHSLWALPLLHDHQLQLPVRQHPLPGQQASHAQRTAPSKPQSTIREWFHSPRRSDTPRVWAQAEIPACELQTCHGHSGHHRSGLWNCMFDDVGSSCLRMCVCSN